MKHILLSILCSWGTLFGMGMAQEGGASDSAAGTTPTLQRVLDDGVLRVGVNPLFKPFSFEQDGARVGVDVDIASLLAEALGVRLELVVPEDFAELIPMLKENEIDVIMAGMSITFERAKEIDFSDPYFETGLSVLFNKARGSALGVGTVQTYEALQSGLGARGNEGELVIAVTEGKAPAEAVPRFFPEAQVKTYASNEEAAEAVIAGDAHIMVHDEIFLKVWLRENGQNTRFSTIVFDEPFKPDAYGFAVRKGNQDFLNLLNVFTRELASEGHFAEFMGNYLELRSRTVTRSYDLIDDTYGGD